VRWAPSRALRFARCAPLNGAQFNGRASLVASQRRGTCGCKTHPAPVDAAHRRRPRARHGTPYCPGALPSGWTLVYRDQPTPASPRSKERFSWGALKALQTFGAAPRLPCFARRQSLGIRHITARAGRDTRQSAGRSACPKPSPSPFLGLPTLGQPRLDYFPPDHKAPCLEIPIPLAPWDYPDRVSALSFPSPARTRARSAYSGRYANAFFRSDAVVAGRPGAFRS